MPPFYPAVFPVKPPNTNGVKSRIMTGKGSGVMAAVQERPPQRQDGPGALEDALAAVARRLRLARWVRHASRGALVAVAVSLVAVVCDHFDLLPDWLPLGGVIAAAFALGSPWYDHGVHQTPQPDGRRPARRDAPGPERAPVVRPGL